MRTRTRILALLGAIALGTVAASPLWAPITLRELSFFEIQRVEVSGMQLVAPHEILTASGVSLGQNVWDDPHPWTEALRSHRGIADVTIERSLPRTLRIRVRERQPVAFVEAGTLRAATAAGELLPVDPSHASIDLPLLRGAVPTASATAETIEDPETLELLAEAGRLTTIDSHLMSRVSEISRLPAGHLVLSLTDPVTRVLIPMGADPARLQRLRSVLQDIEQRPVVAKRGGTHPIQVDLRFADQVVVRYSS